MLPPQPEFKEVLNSFQLVPAQLSPNVVAYIYSFLKLLKARGMAWSLTLFRSLFSWMAVPGYGGCLALQSRSRKAMFSGASSLHSDWRDFYFFVGGDLGIPLTPGACPTEFIGDAQWMAGTSVQKNLEVLKGQSWPLKDFLRLVKNDVSLYARSQGYTIFKEVVPPPETVLMKRARKGQPPATQLSKQVVEEAEGEEVVVPEPVCSGISIDVVSSPDDSGDDGKTLAEVMKEAGKGKEPASLARPKVIPKGAAGVAIGEKGGREEVAEGGPGREIVEVPCPTAAASSHVMVSLEAPKEKRGPSEKNSLEPPLKKRRSDKEGGATDEEREWGKTVEPPLCRNFTGEFTGEGSKFVVSASEAKRQMTITSDQTSNLFNPVRGDLGLVLAGGLATSALEETVERTSTTDLYAQMTNRVVTVLAHLPLAMNMALRVEEQMIDQTGQLHRQAVEIEALKIQLATESSQHTALQEEFAVYKSAMLKADNKALREKDSPKVTGRPLDLPLARWTYERVSDVCRKPRLPGTTRLDDHRI
ncbi:hypothetical protein AXF42_Ash021536 [Apostasia shenzhenica]|uniref:Transposase (putative) gypsy type domain-containing protein n=1 Tax=Apostasia shenzhenica TaxID=1088818 RepID=A0A2H9ZTQ0_9ASPA|nr:hypothetical protein AXF42_Ash021536 [Apostasia shenzhenica]